MVASGVVKGMRAVEPEASEAAIYVLFCICISQLKLEIKPKRVLPSIQWN